MIFEDDAYYFLNFEENPLKRARSYLALEREVNGETGRVMRFDSLSKIVSSGMRLGILTGPTPAVQRVVKITENIKYARRQEPPSIHRHGLDTRPRTDAELQPPTVVNDAAPCALLVPPLGLLGLPDAL